MTVHAFDNSGCVRACLCFICLGVCVFYCVCVCVCFCVCVCVFRVPKTTFQFISLLIKSWDTLVTGASKYTDAVA